jgi:hypothetical protein
LGTVGRQRGWRTAAYTGSVVASSSSLLLSVLMISSLQKITGASDLIVQPLPPPFLSMKMSPKVSSPSSPFILKMHHYFALDLNEITQLGLG